MADGRIMIAATGSGSGKTIISCALMQALKNKGLNVLPYKCGPDYIDPMYHRIALGLDVQAMDRNGNVMPGGNLDTFFTDAHKTVELLYEGGYGRADAVITENATPADMAVIEGVMGLYDGLGGTSITGSSYELATVLKTPIILIVPAKGVGRSVLATIKGFLDYDEHKLIKGIILNRISAMYYAKLKGLIEDELGITVLGYVPEDDGLHIGSRHLGLMTPTDAGESDGCDTGITGDAASAAGDDSDAAPAAYMTYVSQIVNTACEIISDTINIDTLLKIAQAAEPIPAPAASEPTCTTAIPAASKPICTTATPAAPATLTESAAVARAFLADKQIRRMAIAMDEAFCFYYRENLRYLKSLGITLIPYSPLHDDKLPDSVDAIYIGGGYPEEYLKMLEANQAMQSAIRSAADEGIYIIAECGGFMYLQQAIEDKQGNRYKMTGILPGICRWQGKLTRFGYVRLNTDKSEIKGHEFHYYDTDANGEDIEVIKASTGKSYKAMYDNDKMLAGFPHLYYPSVKDI